MQACILTNIALDVSLSVVSFIWLQLTLEQVVIPKYHRFKPPKHVNSPQLNNIQGNFILKMKNKNINQKSMYN